MIGSNSLPRDVLDPNASSKGQGPDYHLNHNDIYASLVLFWKFISFNLVEIAWTPASIWCDPYSRERAETIGMRTMRGSVPSIHASPLKD